MIKITKIFLALALFLFLIDAANAQEQKKLAQAGMKFLSVNVDARSAALSDAVTSVDNMGPAMLFLNPSGISRQTDMFELQAGQMSYIADIKYYYVAGSYVLPNQLGVVGVNLQGVNYGDLLGTIRADNEQGFLNTGTFSPYAYNFGLYYAIALSDKFSVGGGLKYIYQNLGNVYSGAPSSGLTQKEVTKGVLAYDFGVIYKTGFKSLNFGMSVRNFSAEVKYEKEQFQLPLTFKIGLSMNMVDLATSYLNPEQHEFLLSIDAAHYRDYPEQILMGVEYTFMKTVSLRAGVSFPNDEKSYTLGLGLKQAFAGVGVGVDYAYAPFGIFDPVHRISVKFSL